MQTCPDTQPLPGLPPGGPVLTPAPKRQPLPIMTHAERQARAQAKRQAVLAFLGTESWSSAEILSEIVGVSKRRGLYLLAAMEKAGEITIEQHFVDGHQFNVYGITAHGAAIADAWDSVFYRGTLSPHYITHKIEGQRMRLKAEAAGWKNWTPERVLRLVGKGAWKKIPDAIVTDPAGNVVAIEIERNVKTPKRYSDLIVAYLQEIKAGKFQRVEFISPPGVETLVERAIRKVSVVKLMGEAVKLEEKHFARFSYHSFNRWPGGRNG